MSVSGSVPTVSVTSTWGDRRLWRKAAADSAIVSSLTKAEPATTCCSAGATSTRWRSRPCYLAPAPVEGTSITEFTVAAVVSRARDVLADQRTGWPTKAIA